MRCLYKNIGLNYAVYSLAVDFKTKIFVSISVKDDHRNLTFI